MERSRKMGLSFYRCPDCGEIVMMIRKGGCTPSCCGHAMAELKANTTDAATEKHVPVATVGEKEIAVKVGSVEHPMTQEHLIEWIAVETKQGVKIKYLKAGDRPEEIFCNNGDAVAVYAYCNLHGLWKADL